MKQLTEERQTDGKKMVKVFFLRNFRHCTSNSKKAAQSRLLCWGGLEFLTSHDVSNHFDGASSQVQDLMNSLLQLQAGE